MRRALLAAVALFMAVGSACSGSGSGGVIGDEISAHIGSCVGGTSPAAEVELINHDDERETEIVEVLVSFLDAEGEEVGVGHGATVGLKPGASEAQLLESDSVNLDQDASCEVTSLSGTWR